MATPEDSIIALFSHILALKSLPRTGWLLAGVPQPESVADHAYGTTALASFLCDLINAAPEEEGLSQTLDPERVMRIALVHDLAEATLTDLPKRASELLGSDVKHAAERRAIELIMAEFPAGEVYVELWSEYDAAATPEARLVRDADKLDMVLQAAGYSRSSGAVLNEFHEGHTWHYSLPARVAARLQGRER